MPDPEQRRSLLAAALETEAQEARQTAERLESLAGEVEPRLDLVVDRLTPSTWAGVAADEARQQAHMTTGELALASRELRLLAEQLRADAIAWRARASWLQADPTSHVWVGRTESAR